MPLIIDLVTTIIKVMNVELYKDFCDNVNFLVERRGMTRSSLARAMGVTPAYVTQILNGYCEPGLSVIEKVANALDVSPRELFKKRRIPA